MSNWSTPKGFNFRSSSGFVTDGTNQAFINDATYPNSVSIGGETVVCGYGNLPSIRDRNAGNDPRLAGVHFNDLVSDVTFRVDLPATGNFKIRLALGDASTGLAGQRILVIDNATTVLDLSYSPSAAQRFIDPTGTEYTDSTWPGSNSQTTLTFATTTFKFTLKSDGAGQVTEIAHLEIEQVILGAAQNLPAFIQASGAPTAAMIMLARIIDYPLTAIAAVFPGVTARQLAGIYQARGAPLPPPLQAAYIIDPSVPIGALFRPTPPFSASLYVPTVNQQGRAPIVIDPDPPGFSSG